MQLDFFFSTQPSRICFHACCMCTLYENTVHCTMLVNVCSSSLATSALFEYSCGGKSRVCDCLFRICCRFFLLIFLYFSLLKTKKFYYEYLYTDFNAMKPVLKGLAKCAFNCVLLCERVRDRVRLVNK